MPDEPWPPKLTLDQESILNLLTGDRFYSNPSASLREAILNALDAVHRRRRTESNVQPNITATFDRNALTLAVADNGTGMSRADISTLFTKVGASASKAEAGKDSVGEFGIGVISYFMAGDQFTIQTYDGTTEPIGLLFSREMLSGGEASDVSPSQESRGTLLTIYVRDGPTFELLLEMFPYWCRDVEGLTARVLPKTLFGRATLRLADNHTLGSALILPSREKLLTRDPYPRLSQTFLNAADECDFGVFVGSSLRDHHIRGAAQTTARRVPVFIVNPDGQTYGLEDVRPIRQCSSTFLFATLPNALAAADPVHALKSLSRESGETKGMLTDVREALDVNASPDRRCRALEILDDVGAALDPYLLRQLLSDRDPNVARYCLGLISLSAARDSLIDEAAMTIHTQDAAFREDLQLLRVML